MRRNTPANRLSARLPCGRKSVKIVTTRYPGDHPVFAPAGLPQPSPPSEPSAGEDLSRRRNERSERPCSMPDRKSTRLNSSHQIISYAVFCLKKKNKQKI